MSEVCGPAWLAAMLALLLAGPAAVRAWRYGNGLTTPVDDRETPPEG